MAATAVALGVGDALVAGRADWRSLALAGVGALVAFLRTQTTGPVGRRLQGPRP